MAGLAGVALAAENGPPAMSPPSASYTLGFDTACDPALQAQLETIDARLRSKFGMEPNQTSAGALDLNTLRLAMVRPDRIDYAASVPKIAILLAWFQLHPESSTGLDPATRHELGLMIKVSDNALAAKYSQLLGLKNIQGVLDSYGLYDAAHGGGLWMGKHYGKGTERYPDPVGGHSHAATVRQLLRYYLLLEQGRLISPAASAAMREIFASPDIAHVQDKFVPGYGGARRAGVAQGRLVGGLVPRHGRRHWQRTPLHRGRHDPAPERQRLPRRVRRGGGRSAYPGRAEALSLYGSSQLVSGAWKKPSSTVAKTSTASVATPAHFGPAGSGRAGAAPGAGGVHDSNQAERIQPK